MLFSCRSNDGFYLFIYAESDYKLILNEPCDDDVLNIHQTSEHSSPITDYPSVII